MSGGLWLVRHGRPLVHPTAPASRWPLDPAYDADVRALGPRLPSVAVWCSSPEPKALGTARLLTDQDVVVVDDLRELIRPRAEWIDDFSSVVRRMFEQPGLPAQPSWEPLAECRSRVVAAYDTIRSAHPKDDLVLVGHGTAWTVLTAHLRGTEPDLAAWERLDLPDLIVV